MHVNTKSYYNNSSSRIINWAPPTRCHGPSSLMPTRHPAPCQLRGLPQASRQNNWPITATKLLKHPPLPRPPKNLNLSINKSRIESELSSLSLSLSITNKMKPSSSSSSGDIIPGIPNGVAELCLLRLPFPHFSLARSVSSAWNQALSNPTFLQSKSSLSLSLPHLFVLASDRRDAASHRLQWQALDPRSRCWFLLPPMPIEGGGGNICGASLACAADGRRGEIYVIGGMRGDGEGEARNSAVVYSAANNSWRVGRGMRRGRAYFAAAAVGGRVIVAGNGDGGIAEVERYDPVNDRWDDVARMRSGMARYDAAAVGKKMLVTEGWMWPFTFSPRGAIYDADRDAWEEMSVGLREGWTGVSAVVGGTLFVVSEYGEGRVKAYNPVSDTWAPVAGGGVPAELKKPYAVAGADDGRIYVVGRGMDVGVGCVVEEEEGKKRRVEWEVVKGAKGFADLAPCSAQVLYV